MMYGSNRPNELAQIQSLKAMYRGIVPDELLEKFADAILESAELPEFPDDTPEDKQWYLGKDPHSDSLILARRSTVESLAESSAAKDWAKTWGEF